MRQQYVSTIVIALSVLFGGARAWTAPGKAGDKPYRQPTVKKAKEFKTVVYVDPSAKADGTGAQDSPRNTLKDVTKKQDTAFLVKAGTTLTERLIGPFRNVYVGRYGEGKNPVVRWTGQTVLQIYGNSTDVTWDGVDIECVGRGGYHRMIDFGKDCSHLTFANCRIVGVDDGQGYPYYVLKGKADHLTFYRCEIGYCRNDGFYLGGSKDFTFVSNHVVHVNQSAITSGGGTGDGIQMEYNGYDRAYIANNVFDRSDTVMKFCLIINSDANGTKDVVCEWNTFIGPKIGRGGAGVQWKPGSNAVFRKNLFITLGGAAMASWKGIVDVPAPYGVHDNHRYGPGNWCYGAKLDATNLEFADKKAYYAYLIRVGKTRYGSDLFPETEFMAWLASPLPSDWTKPGQNVAIEAGASYGAGVASVALQVDGKEVQTFTKPPYRYEWSKAPAGTHKIRIVATGKDGKVLQKDAVLRVTKHRPILRIEAETCDKVAEIPWSTPKKTDTGVGRLGRDKPNWIAFEGLDLSGGYETVTVAYDGYPAKGAKVVFRAGSPTGKVLGEVALKSTGDKFATDVGKLKNAKGKIDLYVCFPKNAGHLDWIEFSDVGS